MNVVIKTQKSLTIILAVTTVLLLLTVAISFVTPLLIQLNDVTEVNGTVFLENRLFFWIVLLFVFLYCRYVEHQKILTWPESKRNVLFYFLSVLALLALCLIGNILITKLLAETTVNSTSNKLAEYVALFKTDTPLIFFTALTAALVEELLFRGFIQSRLNALFKHPVWAILISSILFAVVHLSYGTLRSFLIPLFIGLIFSTFYWKYKNIKVLIICHFLWDVIAIFVAVHSVK